MNKNFFSDILLKIKLTFRLLKDNRVPFYLKLLPTFCLLYLIVPTDILIGPIDDAVVLYLGMDFFIDFCPREVVAEHMRELQAQSTPAPAGQPPDDDVIDAEFKEK